MPKKKYLVLLVAVAWFAMNRIVLAQTNCTINGEQVPCEEAFQQLKEYANLGLGSVLAMGVLVIASIAFWTMMIAHASSKPIEHKAMWLALLVITGIIGAVLYYFAVKRKFGAPPIQA